MVTTQLSHSAETAPVTGIFNYADVPAGAHIEFTLDPQWSGFDTAALELPVHDARSFPEPPTLAREGFQIEPIASGVTDYADADQIERRWRPAVHALVKRATGADLVVSWSYGARFSERDGKVQRSDVSNPARRVHSDFSPTEFTGEIIHPPARAAVDAVLNGRRLRDWKAVNVWQVISAPPQDTPLAVCDARSVRPEDFVIGRGSVPQVPDLQVDLPLFRPNRDHRWCYFSDMRSDELLLFSGLDPQRPGNWHLVPHSAFDNPLAPADAPPRSSMEMRTLALFLA